MIYHKYSMVGLMLWIRYGLLKGKIFKSLKDIYFNHLESPGTKAYSIREARQLFKNFKEVAIEIKLGHGDLLTSAVGQRHRGVALSFARAIWPRGILKTFFKKMV